MRPRHLRRLRRPDQAQALPGALLARAAAAAAREVRDRRRRAHRGDGRPVPRGDEGRRPGVRPRRLPRRDLGLARRADALRRDRLRRRGGPAAGRLGAERPRRALRHRRQPRLLLRRPAERDLDARPRDRRAPLERGLDAPDRREAVRPRPRLRAGAEHAAAGALRRERGLPDRPLPRQGDGPEPARAALRERDLRADLEPPVRRPRPDHRRRVDRDRGPRRLLRAGGRDPRHLPEPPAAARRADGDGAADRLHRRVGAQREGQGADGDAHARPEARRPRPVRAAGSSRARRCRATATRRASRATR